MKKLFALILTYIMLIPSIAFSQPCDCGCAQPCDCAQSCNECVQPCEQQPLECAQPCEQPQEQVIGIEHMFCEKCSISNKVTRTNLRNIICKGSAFKIVFACKFKSECAKAGDKVNFNVPESVYTQEGTLLIPCGSKVVATVIRIDKQKSPNKNAKVFLKFDCLAFPDGTTVAMSAIPCTKDCSLKEGPWMTTGKLAAYTVGLGAVGAGAATGFAFIPHPLKLGVAYAIGIPVGTSVGLLTGLLTPGLKYHAKEGEAVMIVLCDNLSLPIQNCR